MMYARSSSGSAVGAAVGAAISAGAAAMAGDSASPGTGVRSSSSGTEAGTITVAFGGSGVKVPVVRATSVA